MNLSFKDFKIRFCPQKGRKPLIRFTAIPGGAPFFSLSVAANDCERSAAAAWDIAMQLANKLAGGEIQRNELARVRDQLV
jgi:hypothetical protein